MMRQELRGIAPFEGTATLTITGKGSTNVTKVNASALVLESTLYLDSSEEGTGYYSNLHNSTSDTIHARYTFDRQTLTFISGKTWDERTHRENPIKHGVGFGVFEATFISPSLKEGDRAPNLLGSTAAGNVTYGALTFQGANISVITLRYSGVGSLFSDLGTDNVIQAIYNYEKNARLLISFSVQEIASTKVGMVTTTTNYMLDSTSLWAIETNVWGLLALLIATLLAIVFLTIVLLYRQQTREVPASPWAPAVARATPIEHT